MSRFKVSFSADTAAGVASLVDQLACARKPDPAASRTTSFPPPIGKLMAGIGVRHSNSEGDATPPQPSILGPATTMPDSPATSTAATPPPMPRLAAPASTIPPNTSPHVLPPQQLVPPPKEPGP